MHTHVRAPVSKDSLRVSLPFHLLELGSLFLFTAARIKLAGPQSSSHVSIYLLAVVRWDYRQILGLLSLAFYFGSEIVHDNLRLS